MMTLRVHRDWQAPLALFAGALAVLAGAWITRPVPPRPVAAVPVLCVVRHPVPSTGSIETFACGRPPQAPINWFRWPGAIQEIRMPSVNGRTMIVLSLSPPSDVACSYVGPSVVVRVPGAVPTVQARPLLDDAFQGATITVPTAVARRVVPIGVIASPHQLQRTQCDFPAGESVPLLPPFRANQFPVAYYG